MPTFPQNFETTVRDLKSVEGAKGQKGTGCFSGKAACSIFPFSCFLNLWGRIADDSNGNPWVS